jgi:hypothetical protein
MDFFCTVEKPKIIIKEKEKIFFVEKYKPRRGEDFIIHKNIITKLEKLLTFNYEGGDYLDIINLFLFGAKDSGKYSLARFYIENYFQDPCILTEKTFTFESKEIIYYQSNYHYELIVDSHNCNKINFS